MPDEPGCGICVVRTAELIGTCHKLSLVLGITYMISLVVLHSIETITAIDPVRIQN